MKLKEALNDKTFVYANDDHAYTPSMTASLNQHNQILRDESKRIEGLCDYATGTYKCSGEDDLADLKSIIAGEYSGAQISDEEIESTYNEYKDREDIWDIAVRIADKAGLFQE